MRHSFSLQCKQCIVTCEWAHKKEGKVYILMCDKCKKDLLKPAFVEFAELPYYMQPMSKEDEEIYFPKKK